MLALSIFLMAANTAQASYSNMVGYEPGSDVSQHSFIDLDQQEMEAHLKKVPPDFTAALNIYQFGANSGSHAQFTVLPLAAAVAKGITISETGNTVAAGDMKSAAAKGAIRVIVSYTSKCKSGMPDGGTTSPDTTGCFSSSGNLMAGTVNLGAVKALTNKYRTLAGFSTAAQAKMGGQEFYAPYRAYYNQGDYANQFVLAALKGTGSFAGKDAVTRVECAKKGSAYLNVWMYVIREMEDAIMDCNNGCMNCNDDPVHAWDEMVAFYSGSLEGQTGSSSGKLLYRLAEKRCKNFGTCTGANTLNKGVSAVNDKIVAQSRLGQFALTQGSCVEVISVKRRIVAQMSVPLVQGALRYAYKVAQLKGCPTGGCPKEIAEGAAFSAAILPLVSACDTAAAKLISDNMAITATTPMKSGFASIKQAFEATYACMGITCADVGGLIKEGATVFPYYQEGASPCIDAVSVVQTNQVEEIPVWTIVVIAVVGVVLLAVCVMAVVFMRQARKYKQLAEAKSGGGGDEGDVVGKTGA